MNSVEIEEFLLAHNSDTPKRLNIFLPKGLQEKVGGQQSLTVLWNVSIKAQDERGVLVDYHTTGVPDVFVAWGAINYILESKGY